MPPVLQYLTVLGCTTIGSWLLTLAVRATAAHLRIVDRPDRQRKFHRTAVPLLGGLAIWSAFWLAVVGLIAVGWLPDARFTPRVILGAWLGSTVLMLGGILDDRFGLPPRWQILSPMIAAVFVIASGVRISVVTNPWGGILAIGTSLGIGLTFCWMLGMMYTTKLLDGLDGLVATLTTIGALIIFGLSLTWDTRAPGTSLLALALAGSCLGFLPHNLNPAKIFLGEGGSLVTGYLLGLLAIASGSKIATTLLVMGLPVLDAAWVIVERLMSRGSIVQGDRRHLHYRLLDRGLSPRQVVALQAAIAAGFGLVALVSTSRGKVVALATMLLAVSILMTWARRPFHQPYK